MQLGVRNAVLEIRRFSEPASWYHVETGHNVADLGTREATVAQVAAGSEWQTGQAWMRLPKGQMPIKTAAQVTLTSEEKRQAATELRANDVRGHQVNFNGPTGQRSAHAIRTAGTWLTRVSTAGQSCEDCGSGNEVCCSPPVSSPALSRPEEGNLPEH